jgi:hypothetical protein
MFDVDHILGKAIIEMHVEAALTLRSLDQGLTALGQSEAERGCGMEVNQWQRVAPAQRGNLPTGRMEEGKHLAPRY